MYFAENIKYLRSKNQQTLLQLEKISGVTFSHIRQLENSVRKNVSLEIANKLAKALDVSLDDLVNVNLRLRDCLENEITRDKEPYEDK